jgi:lipopolysaccharide transport system ATP-binding protein
LCERAILLDQGRLISVGQTPDVVRAYLEADTGRTSERDWDDPGVAPGDEVARLRSVRVVPAKGGLGDEIDIREPINIEIEYWRTGTGNQPTLLNVDAFNDEGVCIFALTDEISESWRRLPSRPGLIRSTCRIPGNFLAEGRITLNVAVVTHNPRIGHAVQLDAVAFQVVDRTSGEGVRGTHAGTWPGVVRPMFEWTVEWRPDQMPPAPMNS